MGVFHPPRNFDYKRFESSVLEVKTEGATGAAWMEEEEEWAGSCQGKKASRETEIVSALRTRTKLFYHYKIIFCAVCIFRLFIFCIIISFFVPLGLSTNNRDSET